MIGTTYKINGWADERIGFNGQLTVVDCGTCGIVYAIPSEVERRLRYWTSAASKTNYASTYCPNGHHWHYTGLNSTQVERERAEAAERELAVARAQRDAAERETKRLKKRAEAGVCADCNRTFANVARHVRSKHKGPAEAKAMADEMRSSQ